MSIRPAAVAGQFYEADKFALKTQVNTLLATAESLPQADVAALIVPHAGFIYSGVIAAEAYRCLKPRASTIRRVVLFGPAHRVYLNGMAIPTVDAFHTPLGDIPLDKQALERIKDMPGVINSDEAHRQEHSLEVQLPFLQTVLGEFSLVPIVVGDSDADTVASLLDALWGGDETLRVISSDLSHFHSYDEAREIDDQTCQNIIEKRSDLSGEKACGARAINGLMRSTHSRSMSVKLIKACNSGDTAGDPGRVVGYGAFALQ